MGRTASYVAPFSVRKSETYFYVCPAGRSPESTLGYFAPSRLPAMLGQQPAGLSCVLMNFKPFVCDQSLIFSHHNNCTVSLLRRSRLRRTRMESPVAFFLPESASGVRTKSAWPPKSWPVAALEKATTKIVAMSLISPSGNLFSLIITGFVFLLAMSALSILSIGNSSIKIIIPRNRACVARVKCHWHAIEAYEGIFKDDESRTR